MVHHTSVRLKEARQAYGDPERSRESHGGKMEEFNVEIRRNSALRNRSLVLAALVGLTSAAGTLGALGNSHNILNFNNNNNNNNNNNMNKSSLRILTYVKVLFLQAGVGAGALAYTVGRALWLERVVYDVELRRELWEIDNHLTGEIQEMVAIYIAQGLSEEEALTITRIFAKKRNNFANLMMVEELGYSRLEPPCGRESLIDAALPAALGYLLGYTLPLLPITCINNFINMNNINNNIISRYWPRGEVVALLALAASGVAVSVAQAEVFYGGYVGRGRVVQVVIGNVMAAVAIFATARLASRLF